MNPSRADFKLASLDRPEWNRSSQGPESELALGPEDYCKDADLDLKAGRSRPGRGQIRLHLQILLGSFLFATTSGVQAVYFARVIWLTAFFSFHSFISSNNNISTIAVDRRTWHLLLESCSKWRSALLSRGRNTFVNFWSGRTVISLLDLSLHTINQ